MVYCKPILFTVHSFISLPSGCGSWWVWFVRDVIKGTLARSSSAGLAISTCTTYTTWTTIAFQAMFRVRFQSTLAFLARFLPLNTKKLTRQVQKIATESTKYWNRTGCQRDLRSNRGRWWRLTRLHNRDWLQHHLIGLITEHYMKHHNCSSLNTHIQKFCSLALQTDHGCVNVSNYNDIVRLCAGVNVDTVVMPTSQECVCCCEIERVNMKKQVVKPLVLPTMKDFRLYAWTCGQHTDITMVMLMRRTFTSITNKHLWM